MNLLRVITMIADPLLIGFMVSVIIGVLFKKTSGVLLAKYICVILSAIGYMLLYVCADSLWNNEVVRYIVMYAPVVLILLFIVTAVIFAPKEQITDGEMEKSFKTKKFITGWDSMFPNDIDEYDKSKKS